ncbi:hypothetical protein [Haloprofundus salinisoli]|nr:hypothetical protein [Haloprofundus salinisoli]
MDELCGALRPVDRLEVSPTANGRVLDEIGAHEQTPVGGLSADVDE